MMGSFGHLLLPIPTSVGINTTQNCGMKPWPLPIPSETPNDDRVPIAGQRTISWTIALAHPFVTAHNTLDCLIAEHPVLQHVGILTIVSAHEMHAPSSTFSCPAKAPIPMSPVQTGDQPTKTSEVQFGPG